MKYDYDSRLSQFKELNDNFGKQVEKFDNDIIKGDVLPADDIIFSSPDNSNPNSADKTERAK